MTSYLQLSKTGVAGIVLFVVLLMIFPPTDPDYFWHLKTGEYTVAHHALPGGDVFSFTRAGQPWVLQEWLFEVLLYGVFAAGGESGVVALTAALAMAALALAFTTARRVAGSAGAAWIPAAIGALVIAGCMAPRPRMLTSVFFALYLSLLVATYVGLASALGAVGFGLYIVLRTLMLGNPVPGYPSLLTAVMFRGALQLLGIGIIGEYLARMFDESKQRPLYFLKEGLPGRGAAMAAAYWDEGTVFERTVGATIQGVGAAER